MCIVYVQCPDDPVEDDDCRVTFRWWTLMLPQAPLLVLALYGTYHAHIVLRCARLAGHARP